MVMLRAIGTQFTVTGRSKSSTDSRPLEVTYEVVGYVECIDEYGWSTKAESLKPISIRFLEAPAWIPKHQE